MGNISNVERAAWRHKLNFMLLLLPLAMLVFDVQAQTYQCTPTVQYHCTAQDCKPGDDGFQHAEKFWLNLKSRSLEACLWTTCYEGRATLFQDESSGSLTAIGQLKSAQPGDRHPRLVSLTLERPSGAFTATWNHDGKPMMIDFGTCRDAE